MPALNIEIPVGLTIDVEAVAVDNSGPNEVYFADGEDAATIAAPDDGGVFAVAGFEEVGNVFASDD